MGRLFKPFEHRHILETQFLVINKIPTLRRLTVATLKNLGFGSVTDTDSVSSAKPLLSNLPDPLIIVLELTPSWARTHEMEFLDFLRDEIQRKIPVIVTSEVEDVALFKQFNHWGISDFVLQTFMLEKFGNNLNEAIQKQISNPTGFFSTKK